MDITKLEKYAVIFLVFIMVYSFNSAYALDPAPQSGNILKELEKARGEQNFLNKESPRKEVVIEKENATDKKQLARPDKKVFVSKFLVEGNTLLDESIVRSIISPYEGKELSIEEINAVADLLTAKYRESGYITTRAFVPTQEIKNKVVVIRVADGKVGAITVVGNKSYSTPFVEGHIAQIKKDPTFKEETLERSLLILNDYPSLNVTASLKAGKEPGTTDVIAKVTDEFPISARIFYDNFGTDTTSRNRAGLAIDVGNVITSGDAINLFGIAGIDRMNLSDLAYGRAEYSLPIGANGTKAGVYYGNSVYRAGQELEPLDIKGGADQAGVYVTHPIVKTRDAALSLRLGLDYKKIHQDVSSERFITDDIRTSNVGITCDWADTFSGKNYFALVYAQGLSSLLGGSKSDDAELSRQHANVDFAKFTADLVRVQKLPGYSHLMLKLSGQYSDNRLYGAEQFSIGGFGSVRGFEASAKSGDIGYAMTAELSLSPFFADQEIYKQKVGDTIKFAFFGDYGKVKWNDPLIGQDEYSQLGSIGAGLRLYAGKLVSVRVDYAVPYLDGKFENSGAKTYLQATVSF